MGCLPPGGRRPFRPDPIWSVRGRKLVGMRRRRASDVPARRGVERRGEERACGSPAPRALRCARPRGGAAELAPAQSNDTLTPRTTHALAKHRSCGAIYSDTIFAIWVERSPCSLSTGNSIDTRFVLFSRSQSSSPMQQLQYRSRRKIFCENFCSHAAELLKKVWKSFPLDPTDLTWMSQIWHWKINIPDSYLPTQCNQSKRGRSITQFIQLDNGSKICSNKDFQENFLTYIYSILIILNACASHKERHYTKHALQKKSSIMAVCVF